MCHSVAIQLDSVAFIMVNCQLSADFFNLEFKHKNKKNLQCVTNPKNILCSLLYVMTSGSPFHFP